MAEQQVWEFTDQQLMHWISSTSPENRQRATCEHQRRYAERQVAAAKQQADSAAKQAQYAATIRGLTWAIAAATIVNAGAVAISLFVR
ncbi:MAG: hypothetical protein HY657_17165 [Acidobacteria bacterium]|nr:hypothetical protein [Acidobacteriota bacterium]